jgi:hypothetical protein
MSSACVGCIACHARLAGVVAITLDVAGRASAGDTSAAGTVTIARDVAGRSGRTIDSRIPARVVVGTGNRTRAGPAGDARVTRVGASAVYIALAATAGHRSVSARTIASADHVAVCGTRTVNGGILASIVILALDRASSWPAHDVAVAGI